jgi:Sensors of blue-light using FAD
MDIRAIYKSRCKRASASDWQSILASARRYNPGHGITGALFCDGLNYVQVLEGEANIVDALFLRINDDPRHDDVVLLAREPIEARMFADWAMGFAEIERFAREFLEIELGTGDTDQHVLALLDILKRDQRLLGQVVSGHS